MARVVLSKPEFAAMQSDYVFVHIDIDKEPDTARRFVVRGIPDMRILNAEGKQIHDVSTTWDMNEVLREMRQALKKR
ncbi:MAG: hypothetical protein C4340_07315 [Armatimonadota bacterium]